MWLTMTDLLRPLRVGDRIEGHCGGISGRDFHVYGGKEARVEAIGADWVVVRCQGEPWFAEGDTERLCAHRVALTAAYQTSGDS